MVIEIVYCASQAKGISNPFRTIPATYPLDKEWCELGQDHPRPIVTIPFSIFEEFFYGFQLSVADWYTNHVVVFFRFCELLAAYAGFSEGCNTYAGVVWHDQFCVRVFALGCPANDSVVPRPFALVEGYAKLVWFGWISYPIVLITIPWFLKLPEFLIKKFGQVWTFANYGS
jgi:hypothetical protein